MDQEEEVKVVEMKGMMNLLEIELDEVCESETFPKFVKQGGAQKFPIDFL